VKNLIFVLLIFIPSFAYSQAWQVADPTDKDTIAEYTVITKQQFDRLLRQNEASNTHAFLGYTDVLEMRKGNVVSGSRPDLKGYYYLLRKIIPKTSDASSVLTLIGGGIGLIYGNSETGEIRIIFINELGTLIPGIVKIGSDDYVSKFNQFVKFVSGE
jgi:hypothetical protein